MAKKLNIGKKAAKTNIEKKEEEVLPEAEENKTDLMLAKLGSNMYDEAVEEFFDDIKTRFKHVLKHLMAKQVAAQESYNKAKAQVDYLKELSIEDFSRVQDKYKGIL